MNKNLKKAKQVLKQESRALNKMAGSVGQDFLDAVELIKNTTGKVVVMGMGKSGLIGQKLAATLSSTGTPAIFVNAAESLHGDIGVIDSKDLVLILSYSGTTEEIARIIPAVKRLNVPIIAITGNRNSQLGKSSDTVIELNIDGEACPMNLVPTTSTTVMLSLGDALAVVLLEEKGFKAEDFATLHPGGTLGKKLLLKVKDILRNREVNPVVKTEDKVQRALMEMTRTRIGATSVVGKNGKLVGYFTDGDLRREMQKNGDILSKKIEEVMSPDPTTVNMETLAIEARDILKNNNFDNLPVVSEDRKPVGIIDERDIIKEGL
ncbi:MAG: KpsF/GutQ family sugar-phosphate isomerase [Elusimicrobiota bacterium]